MMLDDDRDERPEVAIIVLNWNNYPDTEACLESLSDICYSNYRTIVVDNGSTDGSTDKLKRAYSDEVDDFIENKENLGYAGGNNVGIRKALSEGVDYVLLLNNDTIVTPNFLEQLVTVAEYVDQTGVVGPKILNSNDKTVQSTGFRQSPIFPFYKRDGPETTRWECDYVHGCCVLISEEVFEEIGLLDEEYFLYVEERDFYIRAKKAGYKVIMNPDSVVVHEGMGSTSGALTRIGAYWKIRNLFRCWKKHFPLWYQITFIPYMVVFTIVHLELYNRSINEIEGVTVPIFEAWVDGLLGIDRAQSYKPE